MNKKNALKELVKKLKADVGIVRAFKKDLGDKEDEVGGMMIDDIDKASRIIAELANVEDQRDGETNSDVLWRCNDCIAKCRTIAEEGEKMTRGNEDRKLSMCDVCIHNGAKSCKGLAKCNFMRMTDDAQSEEAK